MPEIPKMKGDLYNRPPRPSDCLEGVEGVHNAPFVTGSRAYGEPTTESDVDLVIYVAEGLRDYLARFTEGTVEDKPIPHYALRFGALNLICCIRPRQYAAWLVGTSRLIAERPVTRERAIEVLNEERKKLGVEKS